MVTMSARHNARAGVRARLKIEILHFLHFLPRGHHMLQNSTSEWQVGGFWHREAKEHHFGSIILRFHAIWIDILIFGKF